MNCVLAGIARVCQVYLLFSLCLLPTVRQWCKSGIFCVGRYGLSTMCGSFSCLSPFPQNNAKTSKKIQRIGRYQFFALKEAIWRSCWKWQCCDLGMLCVDRYGFTVMSNVMVYLVTWMVLGLDTTSTSEKEAGIGPEDAAKFRVSVLNKISTWGMKHCRSS